MDAFLSSVEQLDNRPNAGILLVGLRIIDCCIAAGCSQKVWCALCAKWILGEVLS
jgi:hypothetical protein